MLKRFQTVTALAPTVAWKTFPDSKPQVVVSGFAVDKDGRFPILYRSDKVRSAKNCWSLPSGCHEIGITIEDQFCNELVEELGLQPLGEVSNVGVYENIALVDNWHWTINLHAVGVESHDALVNKEPDKHSEIKLVTFGELYSIRPWAPCLEQTLVKYKRHIHDALMTIKDQLSWHANFQQPK